MDGCSDRYELHCPRNSKILRQSKDRLVILTLDRDPKILKIYFYDSKRRLKRVKNNIKAVHFFQNNGIPIPSLFGVQFYPEYAVVAFEYIKDAKNLWEIRWRKKIIVALETVLADLLRECLHSKVRHGDLNFGNVLINKKGNVFLIDFDHFSKGNVYLDLVTFYTDFLIYYYLKSAASKWFKKLAHFVFRQIKHHYNESEINCLIKKVLTRYKPTYGFTREDIRAIIKIQDELLSKTSLT